MPDIVTNWEKNHTYPAQLSPDREKMIKECTELHNEVAELTAAGEQEEPIYEPSDVEQIVRCFERFFCLAKELQLGGFLEYMPDDPGTCWHDMLQWEPRKNELKEIFKIKNNKTGGNSKNEDNLENDEALGPP